MVLYLVSSPLLPGSPQLQSVIENLGILESFSVCLEDKIHNYVIVGKTGD